MLRPLSVCTLRLVVIGLLCSPTLSAQMSGTYTIDPTASGSRNFKDFPNAAYQLFVQGVSGPVMFDVVPGSYSTAFNLGPVKGVSSTNTITFKSKTKHAATIRGQITILDYTAQFPVSWYVFDGFQFIVGTAISARGTCTDFEIKNCLFVDSKIGIGSGSNQGTQRWRVHHNTFQRSSCICTHAQDIHIHHNEFDLTNAGKTASAISMVNDSTTTLRNRIYNNVIYGTLPVSGSRVTRGISTGPNVDIFHNTVLVHALYNGNPTTGSYCIDTAGVFGRECRVGNNIMVTLGTDDCANHATAPFATFTDGNLYLSKHPANAVVNNMSLSSWQQASGQDKNSFQTDPQFVGPGKTAADLKPKPTSPAFGKAVNTPAYITDDFFGMRRLKTATIGAIEATPPSTFTTFGTGCAGTGGKVPIIGMSGNLILGSTDFAVTLKNAKGGLGSTLFALGATKTNLHFGGGCTLLVTPGLLFGAIVSGPNGAGNGTASVKLTIPANAKFRGVIVHCQWGVLDSAAKGIGIAFSNGATIQL